MAEIHAAAAGNALRNDALQSGIVCCEPGPDLGG